MLSTSDPTSSAEGAEPGELGNRSATIVRDVMCAVAPGQAARGCGTAQRDQNASQDMVHQVRQLSTGKLAPMSLKVIMVDYGDGGCGLKAVKWYSVQPCMPFAGICVTPIGKLTLVLKFNWSRLRSGKVCVSCFS
ncbi:hypothetical protein VOLCADRAFT_93300 [Volvox carteri f. nagariensis]|uniref:Uncharacterized protein n=1 Tax=Volvox carteri f. nagariensis TaxID=3068 RepID=D8U1S2_VOLCA|nr:uncharacterized protein VOLCADRAFT_93300 [Volvox carteri f. nagariensis]EFJ46392.1 hypothetical protein VOLCADRAFT_93300 [Volvox carteri f. nagariensis]|eukprot:XP_002952545.1 hypothetical protein VOLCADRAFT_93300 [Volvox carteri f. nagariensis]